MERNAVISMCGKYRYWLSRKWDDINDNEMVCWVMLNPSIADGNVDDPTIRKCIGFSKQIGSGGLQVVNLFAYRATNPRELLNVRDPVGVQNCRWLRDILLKSNKVIFAWGSNGGKKKLIDVGPLILINNIVLLQNMQEKFFRFGLTKNGQPLHPLMLPYSSKLERVYE